VYTGTLTPSSTSFDSPEPTGDNQPTGYAKGTYYYQLFAIEVKTAGPYIFQATTNFLYGSEGILYQAPGPIPDAGQITGASVTNSLMAVGSSRPDFTLTKTLNVGQYYFAVSTYAEKITGSFTLMVKGPEPLPVQLVAFTARIRTSGTHLVWATASEVQNAFFRLERSLDGQRWQEVARIPGSGTSIQERRYEWLDSNTPAGTSYYRLGQTDVNGLVTYSPVVSTVKPPAELSFFPNPVSTQATFTSPAATKLRVYDAAGRMCQLIQLDGGSQQVLLDKLTPGTYSLLDEQTHQAVRLVKLAEK
jgi:hypothetical protein